MQDETKNGKTSTINTVLGKDDFRVTCVERKYKVSNSKIGFIVTAKKELDENTTNELLHEDMELKTFLTNYEITDVVPISMCDAHVDAVDRNVQTRKMPIAGIMTKKNGMPARNGDIRVINDFTSIKSGGMSVKCDDKLMKNRSVANEMKSEAVKRRELFDSLDLQERFVVKDYKEALEKKGIVITNTAMPYDDLERLAKQGKIVRIEKGERGVVVFTKKRNDEEILIR
jgi:hypothetical protein